MAQYSKTHRTLGLHQEAPHIRLPLPKCRAVQRVEEHKAYAMPLYGCSVRAGFPSPADDYIECYLDLNAYLVQHPSATFFVRASGDSMINVGISPGDLLIVDRSIKATHNDIVIAAVNGELTVKRLYVQNQVIKLLPENNRYAPIVITEGLELVVWGVVLHAIRSVF